MDGNLAMANKLEGEQKESTTHFYRKPKNFLFLTIEKSDGEKSEILYWIPRFIPKYNEIAYHVCIGLRKRYEIEQRTKRAMQAKQLLK